MTTYTDSQWVKRIRQVIAAMQTELIYTNYKDRAITGTVLFECMNAMTDITEQYWAQRKQEAQEFIAKYKAKQAAEREARKAKLKAEKQPKEPKPSRKLKRPRAGNNPALAKRLTMRKAKASDRS